MLPAYIREELLAWALSCVEDEPGIWTAALCRAMNGLPETEESVIWCGLCTEYANPRKRARAARKPPLLPGFDEGAHQLHGPCPRMQLRLLRSLLATLEQATMVRGEQGAVIPDRRNHRGWDYATRWYPLRGTR
ncbi:MAG: hypothetical protein JXD18_14935 [Anaerolineae bacterium]|nr:hypothetical protein [Anaerolineae bacterium]